MVGGAEEHAREPSGARAELLRAVHAQGRRRCGPAGRIEQDRDFRREDEAVDPVRRRQAYQPAEAGTRGVGLLAVHLGGTEVGEGPRAARGVLV